MNKRKKLQRKMNKVLRVWNKDLRKDPLWQGRYFFHQERQCSYMEEDGFYSLGFLISCCDSRRPQDNKSFFISIYNGKMIWSIDFACFEYMNKFISEQERKEKSEFTPANY